MPDTETAPRRERKRRFTISRQQADILASTARAKGCTAAIVFPDGMRIELTPAPEPPAHEDADSPLNRM